MRRRILMPPTFPIARLNRYTPNFSGVTQKLTWCQQFGLQIFPKWGDAHICHLEMAVFRCFLDEISFPGQTVDFSLQHVVHIWKAMALSYNLVYQEIISVHPTRRQNFAGKTDSTFWNIWQWVIYENNFHVWSLRAYTFMSSWTMTTLVLIGKCSRK